MKLSMKMTEAFPLEGESSQVNESEVPYNLVDAEKIEKQHQKQMIEVFLKYGFEDDGLIKPSTKDLRSLYQSNLVIKKKQTQLKRLGGGLQFEQGHLNLAIILKKDLGKNQITVDDSKAKADYSAFKLVERKEETNKMKNLRFGGENSENGSLSKQIRSKSVTNVQRKYGQVTRFYNFDKERQKSRVDQLLSKPIEIPSYLDSSFLKDDYIDSKSLRSLKSLIKNETVTIQLPKIGSQERRYDKESNFQPYGNIQLTRNQPLFKRHETQVERIISRPLETTMKRQVQLIRQQDGSQPRLASSTVRLRKLATQINKEPDVFTRQRLLFQLVDQAQDQPIGLSDIKQAKEDPMKSSPFKNEKPESSIIAQIRPTFPLKQQIISQIGENLQNKIKEAQVQSQLQAIANQEISFALNNLQTVEKTFEIQTAKFNHKMSEMGDIMEQKLFDVHKQCIDDNFIQEKLQNQLDQQTKLTGKKIYSNKRFEDFEILVWPKVKQIFDHRGIQLSKTGYERNEDLRSEGNGEEADLLKKSDETQFQTDKVNASIRRKERHLKCLNEQSPRQKQSLSRSPRLRGQLHIKKSSPRKPSSPGKLTFEIASQQSIHERKSSQDMNETSSADVKFSRQRSRRISKLGNESQRSNEKLERRESIGKSQVFRTKSIKKKKKQTKEEKEKEEEEELKRKRDKEHEEYWEEMRIIRQEELLQSVRKFADKRRDALEDVSKEIVDLENYSDDEFDIYQNHQIANAFSSAKKKVMKQIISKQKSRITNSTEGSPERFDSTRFKISVTGPLDSEQFHLSKESSISQGGNTLSPPLHGPQKFDFQTVQVKEISDKMKVAMLKVVNQQRFAQQIVKVYQKNENIDYDSKLKSIRKKALMLQQDYSEVEPSEVEGGIQAKVEHTQIVNQDFEEQSDEERYEEEFTRDQFMKEEAMEIEMLQKKMADEAKEIMHRKYLQLCKNEQVLPLPIIHKIFEGVLSLDDYKLNFGLCKALGNVLEDLGDSIYKIVLRNNGITDLDFSEIIKGALKNKNIKSLAIRNNEFKEESLKELQQYFVDKKKPVLEELVISQCKTKLTQVNELLKALSDYNNLRVLALCQSKLDKQSVKYLGDVANGNINLRELDLSWNEVTALNMWELVQNIEFCRHISYLNLSFNSFVGSKTNEIVESLCNFIKRNRKLLHLDISYCGLKKDEVLSVVKSCKKSRSLLAIHLTGNLITDETKQKIREFMRPRKRVKDLYDMINEPDVGEGNQPVKLVNFDLAAAIQAKLRQYQIQEAQNNPQQKESSNSKGSVSEKLIFSRILGHVEIPRSYLWVESHDCWICERYRYTVMVMSETIAKTFFVQPHDKDRDQFISKIKDARGRRDNLLENNEDNDWGSDDDEIYYDADVEEEKHQNWLNNLISGTFSHWKCRSVLPLGEFMRRIKKNLVPSTTIVSVDKEIYEKQVSDFRAKMAEKEKFRKELRRQNAKKSKEFGLEFDNKVKADWGDIISAKDYEHVKSSWIYEMQSTLPYKDSVNLVVGLDKLIELNKKSGSLTELQEKVYVYADYLPPGKHNTCLLYNTDETPKKGLYTFVSPVRPRELPLEIYTKRVKEYQITRRFDRMTSMFKDFTEDTPQFLKRSFYKDIEQWKVGRMIKDMFEYRRVCDLLIEYTEQIKDIFTNAIALSSYPSISWIDFGNMCTQWKLLDNRTCTMSTIDRIFIATNVELVEQDDNPDRDLCRFEFFEIIVRLAGAKYKDSGAAKTWDDAIKMILDQKIIPNTQTMGGLSFRNKYIWQLPIDDLFRANLENVTKLLKKYSTDRRENLDIEGCIEMVEDLQIPEIEVKQAYAFSKMTIYDEMNEKDKYDIMLLPELQDFICRCAYFKYKDQPGLQFVEKVERVMDMLFKQIEVRRQKPNFEIEVSSDSDYQSDD